MKVEAKLAGHRAPIAALAISGDGRRLITGDEQATVCLWDVASGKKLRSFRVHKGSGGVEALALSADGTRALISAGLAGMHRSTMTLALWDVDRGRRLRILGRDRLVQAVAFVAGDEQAIAGNNDGSVSLYSLPGGKPIRRMRGHARLVTSIAVSHDGRTAVSGSYDGQLKLWNVATGKLVATLDHGDDVNCVALAPDATVAASGGDDRTLRVWDVGKRKQVARSGEQHTVEAVAFSPDGVHLATGNARGRWRVYRLARGKLAKVDELSIPIGPKSFPHAAVWTRDGRSLFVGGEKAGARLAPRLGKHAVPVAAPETPADLFRSGRRGANRVQVKRIGEIVVTSGRVAVGDPFTSLGASLTLALRTERGRFPVELSIAHLATRRGSDRRVMAARVRFSDDPVASWEPAQFAGSGGKRAGHPGYPVDSGTGCFVDAAALRVVDKLGDGWHDALTVPARGWAQLVLDRRSGLNLFAFTTGWGDGVYGSWWGLSRRGRPVELVTDFGVNPNPS